MLCTEAVPVALTFIRFNFLYSLVLCSLCILSFLPMLLAHCVFHCRDYCSLYLLCFFFSAFDTSQAVVGGWRIGGSCRRSINRPQPLASYDAREATRSQDLRHE